MSATVIHFPKRSRADRRINVRSLGSPTPFFLVEVHGANGREHVEAYDTRSAAQAAAAALRTQYQEARQ